MNIKKGEQMKKLMIAILIMSVLVLPVLANETSDLCKKIAVERFPNDYNMQTFVYNQQMESQKYMSGDRDEECKKIAQERFPRDFHMQRFVYNQQVEAYNYLVECDDDECLKIAENRFPDDFHMQKFVYLQQVKAKKTMRGEY